MNRTTENKEIGQLASVIWNLITGLYFVFRISGGLGTMGIKLAKALGNDVMAISSSAHKEALAKVITELERSWKNKKWLLIKSKNFSNCNLENGVHYFSNLSCRT